MEKAIDSKLSFEGFKINNSRIDIKGTVGPEMNIGLDASGEIKKAEQVFHLTLKVQIEDSLKGMFIEVLASSDYKLIDADIEDPIFSNYLYLNAPAILFPYIRSYITALTALSGVPPVIIPPINIAGIKESLKEHTQVIESQL